MTVVPLTLPPHKRKEYGPQDTFEDSLYQYRPIAPLTGPPLFFLIPFAALHAIDFAAIEAKTDCPVSQPPPAFRLLALAGNLRINGIPAKTN